MTKRHLLAPAEVGDGLDLHRVWCDPPEAHMARTRRLRGTYPATPSFVDATCKVCLRRAGLALRFEQRASWAVIRSLPPGSERRIGLENKMRIEASIRGDASHAYEWESPRQAFAQVMSNALDGTPIRSSSDDGRFGHVPQVSADPVKVSRQHGNAVIKRAWDRASEDCARRVEDLGVGVRLTSREFFGIALWSWFGEPVSREVVSGAGKKHMRLVPQMRDAEAIAEKLTAERGEEVTPRQVGIALRAWTRSFAEAIQASASGYVRPPRKRAEREVKEWEPTRRLREALATG